MENEKQQEFRTQLLRPFERNNKSNHHLLAPFQERLNASSATHCNRMQHTEAHCSTLQHTATHTLNPLTRNTEGLYPKTRETKWSKRVRHGTESHSRVKHQQCLSEQFMRVFWISRSSYDDLAVDYFFFNTTQGHQSSFTMSVKSFQPVIYIGWIDTIYRSIVTALLRIAKHCNTSERIATHCSTR